MTRITITPSGQAFDCEDDTILRAALRAGHGFPYECNVGSCGNCRFELTEGAVEHLRHDAPAWTERDKQRKRYLGCQARPLGDCTIKVRLDPRYAALRPRRTRATLIAREALTHDIAELRFALETAQPFLAGQYALLAAPGVDGTRGYSMSNAAGDGSTWEFMIKRVPGGAASGALLDRLAIGEVTALDGPYGMAYLRADAPRDILCIAGGSGLAPMVAITRAFAIEPKLAGRRLHFVYGGRGPRDICGEAMLRALPGFGTRLFYHAAISMPDPAWTGHTGFVHEVARAIFGADMAGFEVYFAGPPAMATATQKMLFDAGVPPAQMHFDQFL